jgi:hypothetical protein
MIIDFGPVDEAARGGHNSPSFDFIVGFVVLALTWVGFFRKEERQKASVWAAIGVSAICAVFIGAGILELLR